MLRARNRLTRTGIIARGIAAVLLLSMGAIAAADSGMGAHYGMGGKDHCDMHKDGGWGHGGGGMRPHNAAAHFLKMGDMLNLTADQTKQLTKMRDEYIQKNAAAEDQLTAAYDDVRRTLWTDQIDLSAANGLFDKVGKLESQLWRAFAQQLHDIKAMLTPEQRELLSGMWGDGPHGMGAMHGDMPIGHGNMPMGGR
jgi:Spy/CpxP family protein refolding chaperone